MIVKLIITVHCYYENNHEYTKNIIEKGYEKMNKKILLRDTRVSVYKSKEEKWNKITKSVNHNMFNYERTWFDFTDPREKI